MAFAPTSSRQDAMSQMNITPLVDVMLVMLVIFMIVAPILSRPIPLDLPSKTRGGDPPELAAPLRVQIDATGSLFVDGRPMPLTALASVFEAEHVRAGTKLVPLQLDVNDQAEYQIVARVVAAAKNAGLENIRFL
ncbi:MAG: biopolymer transporter ExbD [Xanthomonadales bacterium]|nr:biopolymer transporter ExbD [Xanthomonadales bacterium]